MAKLTKGKYVALKKLSDNSGIIAALAIDQRGSLSKMISSAKGSDAGKKDIEDFKVLVSEELTPYASAILLDTEYGIEAAKRKNKNCGLIISYEKTGYDTTEPGRAPDLLKDLSAKRIKELGGDAVKLLVYYDVDESEAINDHKNAFIERVGSECKAEDIPLFLEIVSYDAKIDDVKSAEYAKIKPHKVIELVKEFTKERYGVNVLKLEVPVNMEYVEGFGKDKKAVYTREEAKKYFKEQSDASTVPFIYLSAGVSTKLFHETIKFAGEAGSNFCGVLCGRATWKDDVAIFAKEGENAAREWLKSTGKNNINELNDLLKQYAKPWTYIYGGKVEVEQ